MKIYSHVLVSIRYIRLTHERFGYYYFKTDKRLTGNFSTYEKADSSYARFYFNFNPYFCLFLYYLRVQDCPCCLCKSIA